ncbi:MAG TPA: hypothetical protein PKY31_12770 [Spirochaetota bacterium]|mgnify:CR=1 FL=1|nr:hypothetical protein [Spirochaetota bacterium]
MEDLYDVRLSRIAILVFLGAGLFFLLAGLEIGFLHIVIGPISVAPDRLWAYYAFLAFFIGVGGAATIQMLLYLVSPPVMFRASAEGIAFASGMRYRPYLMAWKHVESVGAGVDLSQPLSGQGSAGLQVTIRQTGEVPGDMATSIGVKYFMYVLTLNIFYMDRPVKEAVERVREMHRKFGGS